MPAHSKTKVELLLAGIQEVRLHGVQNFSVRRIAASCGVSCSAPYKHFKNKNDYILAILHYINQQWHEVEHEILSQVPNDTRERLVASQLGLHPFLAGESPLPCHPDAPGRVFEPGADSGKIQSKRLHYAARTPVLP